MHTYTYYGDGSLHEVKTGQTTVASYTYHDSRLLDTASYNGRTLTNTWDADSNRVEMNANGSEYEFVYDTIAGVPAVLKEVTPSDTVYYIREPSGALLARVQDTTKHYYQFDELGSTRLLTDVDGNVTDKYAYDAWGAAAWHERATGSVDQPYQFVGELGYYTHYQEPTFGLLQLGVRFYEPEVGRFGQCDRAPRIDEAAYPYASGTPSGVVDPSGAVPKLPNEWMGYIHKAIGRLEFGTNYGWPPKLDDKVCCGLTARQCWAKIVRCIVYVESGDNPNAENPRTSAKGLMQIMMSFERKGHTCRNYLRAVGILKANEDFDWRNPQQNLTCGIYKLYGCWSHGGLKGCGSSTYTSIPTGGFSECMKSFSP